MLTFDADADSGAVSAEVQPDNDIQVLDVEFLEYDCIF
jgi:hypothetical protein